MPQKKPESIESLISEHNNHKPKRVSQINKFFYDKYTPEEIAAKRAAGLAKRLANNKAKRERQLEIERKADELAPRLLAEQILQESSDKDNWVPSQKTINDFKFFAKENISLEDLRAKHFPLMRDEAWHALLKFVFKSQIANSEDLGAEIIRSKQKGRDDLVKQQREINKQIKYFKEEKKTKVVPAYLMQMKMDITKEIVKQEQDIAKTLHQIGAVGDKSKAPSLTVNFKLPRPEKIEKVVVDAD